jgi:UDP-2,3-diacylglucosamine pyrophosphatase LpxH
MSREYYFVSDLHFGGDGQLQVCDYTEEFIAFLRQLAARGKDAEMIIAGDTFGFWELTTVQGVEQLDEIIKHHTRIFEQFRLTGAEIKITMMVGNHDYDLACYPEFAEKLAAYNVGLDLSLSLVREIAGRKIWIEHGQQIDPYNAATPRPITAIKTLCRSAISSPKAWSAARANIRFSAQATGSKIFVRWTCAKFPTGSSRITSTTR